MNIVVDEIIEHIHNRIVESLGNGDYKARISKDLKTITFERGNIKIKMIQSGAVWHFEVYLYDGLVLQYRVMMEIILSVEYIDERWIRKILDEL